MIRLEHITRDNWQQVIQHDASALPGWKTVTFSTLWHLVVLQHQFDDFIVDTQPPIDELHLINCP